MDWSKVDAALAGALAGGDDPASARLTVFVHLGEAVEPDVLEAMGVEPAGDGLVRTATVTAADVDRLTEQIWVSHLRLSTALGPLGGT